MTSPGLHVEVDVRARRWPGRTPTRLRRAVDRRCRRTAIAVTEPRLGQRVDPLRHGRAQPAHAELRVDDPVALHRLVDRRRHRRPGRCREHRDEGRPAPTPIISAEAVADVRRGLRVAFSRASVPAMPRKRGSGEPTTRVNGRAMTGPRIATPMNTTSAPRPTVRRCRPTGPWRSNAAPTSVDDRAEHGPRLRRRRCSRRRRRAAPRSAPPSPPCGPAGTPRPPSPTMPVTIETTIVLRLHHRVRPTAARG